MPDEDEMETHERQVKGLEPGNGAGQLGEASERVVAAVCFRVMGLCDGASRWRGVVDWSSSG